MNTDVNVIQISHLELSFGKKKVIKDVSLNIKKGESLAVLGCSGSGKSVFVKSIVGLFPVSKGTIKIYDELVSTNVEYNSTRYNIGITFQNDALFDGMTVIDNLCFGLIHRCSLKASDAKNVALEALKKMGFQEHVATLLPSELSGGMRKRIATIRTIILNPEIVFFDEPTTGLDPINSDKIINIICEYIASSVITSITITHSLDCAKNIADNIAFIHEGMIVWCGKKEDFKHSGNEHFDNFLKFYMRHI